MHLLASQVGDCIVVICIAAWMGILALMTGLVAARYTGEYIHMYSENHMPRLARGEVELPSLSRVLVRSRWCVQVKALADGLAVWHILQILYRVYSVE